MGNYRRHESKDTRPSQPHAGDRPPQPPRPRSHDRRRSDDRSRSDERSGHRRYDDDYNYRRQESKDTRPSQAHGGGREWHSGDKAAEMQSYGSRGRHDERYRKESAEHDTFAPSKRTAAPSSTSSSKRTAVPSLAPHLNNPYVSGD